MEIYLIVIVYGLFAFAVGVLVGRAWQLWRWVRGGRP